MLTSCVLDKLLLFCSRCSFSNFSFNFKKRGVIYLLGFFYDLGSGWLKMEKWDLYFQFSCVNELTLTFFYFKQAAFAKFFSTSQVYSVGTEGYQYLLGFPGLSWLPLDGDSL